MIETTDLLFATDSIPAVLAITREPFIVYTSNVFAILGLRSLYFALAGMMEVFHLLHYGLSVILIFIGAKMMASQYVHIPIGIALGVVAGVLVVSVVLSLIFPQKVGSKRRNCKSFRGDLLEANGVGPRLRSACGICGRSLADNPAGSARRGFLHGPAQSERSAFRVCRMLQASRARRSADFGAPACMAVSSAIA